MKFDTTAAVLMLVGVASARPDAVRRGNTLVARLPARTGGAKFRREVPQEHSHEAIVSVVRTSLNINNPEKIQDPIFSLLGNAAAAAGAGTVTDLNCLQQHVADQAFSNAKAAADVNGMVNALLFRGLERNTGSVGLASALCTETATNPEIAAITQHQDPASANAAATNKQVALSLAVQIAAVGGNAQDALKAGTFAPGTVGDPTAKGNSCDEITTNGCIVDDKLLVDDATAAEIDAAVKAGGAAASAGSSASTGNATATDASADCPAETTAAAVATVTTSAAAVASTTVASSAQATDAAADCPADASTATTPTATVSGANVNTFTGSLGSPPVPVQSSTGDRPFTVNGNTFVNIGAAIQRACDIQQNACSNAANSGAAGISVSACQAQQQQCQAAAASKKRRTALRV